MKSKRDQIWDSLSDPEYRKQFIDEHVNVGIAFQIRSLRNRQNLTQADLARALNVKQPLLSSWENPNYGNYSLNTLKELAKAFDVGLLVRFVQFSKLVDWTVDLTPEVIAPASFEEEQNFGHTFMSASATSSNKEAKMNITANNPDPLLHDIPEPVKLASTANTNAIPEKELVYAS